MNQQYPSIDVIKQATDLVTTKWVLAIVFYLRLKQEARFSEIQSGININSRTLTERLELLEEHHLVERIESPTPPPHMTYVLTEKGVALTGLMSTLSDWFDQYYSHDSCLEKGGDV